MNSDDILRDRVGQAVSCFRMAAKERLQVGKLHHVQLPELLPIADPMVADLLLERLVIAKIFITWVHGAAVELIGPNNKLRLSTSCITLELRSGSKQLTVAFTNQTVHFMRTS